MNKQKTSKKPQKQPVQSEPSRQVDENVRCDFELEKKYIALDRYKIFEVVFKWVDCPKIDHVSSHDYWTDKLPKKEMTIYMIAKDYKILSETLSDFCVRFSKPREYYVDSIKALPMKTYLPIRGIVHSDGLGSYHLFD